MYKGWLLVNTFVIGKIQNLYQMLELSFRKGRYFKR